MWEIVSAGSLAIGNASARGFSGAVPLVMAVPTSGVVRTGVWSLHVCVSPHGAQCEPRSAALLHTGLTPAAAALPEPFWGSSFQKIYIF